jgi:hypothetical protein
MSESPQHGNHPGHELPWKAVVAFNPALGWPVLHTQAEYMSATGAVITSDYGNLTGAQITLILDLPPGVDAQTTVLRVPARVTSTLRIPQQDRYRHDLEFVRAPNDRLDILDRYFSGQAESPVLPAPQTPAEPPLSHLDKLKALAQQKLAEEKAQQKLAQEQAQLKEGAEKPQPPAIPADDVIDNALRRTYAYFKELVEQLNVVKPAFPKQYAIAGVPEFGGLSWGGGRAECFFSRETLIKRERMERVSLNFALSGGEPIQLDREYPASDRLKRLLDDSKVPYTKREVYNARGSLERVKFEVPRTVDASVQLTARFETGKIQLNTTHVAGFGAMQRLVAPEAISEASLNELSGFILGEIRAQMPLLLQGG